MRRPTVLLLSCLTAGVAGCSRPEPVDVTKAMGFSYPSACIFMPQGEHAFDDMLHGTDEFGGMRSDPFINIDGRNYEVRAKSENSPAEEAYHHQAKVNFPKGSRWHGLKLDSMTADEDFVLGKDGMQSRWLTLDEPLERVRAFVRSMEIPLDGADGAPLEIIDNRSCEGRVSLRPVGARTELRCEWGC